MHRLVFGFKVASTTKVILRLPGVTGEGRPQVYLYIPIYTWVEPTTFHKPASIAFSLEDKTVPSGVEATVVTFE